MSASQKSNPSSESVMVETALQIVRQELKLKLCSAQRLCPVRLEGSTDLAALTVLDSDVSRERDGPALCSVSKGCFSGNDRVSCLFNSLKGFSGHSQKCHLSQAYLSAPAGGWNYLFREICLFVCFCLKNAIVLYHRSDNTSKKVHHCQCQGEGHSLQSEFCFYFCVFCPVYLPTATGHVLPVAHVKNPLIWTDVLLPYINR